MDDEKSVHHSVIGKLAVIIEWVIYNARFSLVALYGMVTVALFGFIIISIKETYNFLGSTFSASLESATIAMLTLVDSMMVANVVYLITVGSYIVYVKPKLFDNVNSNEDQRPPALHHLTPTGLKERMAGSFITISAVNLIRVLLENHDIEWRLLVIKCSLHLLFIVGIVVFIWAERQHNSKESVS